jgi:putative flippase GtrA
MDAARTIKQFFKYGLVGISNTLITAAVIWIMMELLKYSSNVSNITGYLAGFINSFIWNKQWTFKSSDSWGASAVRFSAVFGICYLLQFGLLNYLDRHLLINPFYNQLLAMAFFTAINFPMNKFLTFKEQNG